MNTTELLKTVRRIEIKTRGLSNNLFSGEYHSAFKGRGMAFSEVREYQYGDDIRFIDWNVTARYNHPYIKVFEEERELTTLLVADVSGSALFGTRRRQKRELMAEICATLAFSAGANNDKVGAALFSESVEKMLPPRKGRSHILQIIRELLEFHPQQQGTNIASSLQYISNIFKRKAIVFIVSDFMDDGYSKALDVLSRRHDCIGIRLYDKAEMELPNIGLIRTVHPETGQEEWLDTSDSNVRSRYKQMFLEAEDRCQTTFRRCGADLLSISTEESYPVKLANFFRRRIA